jgi:SPOR domain
MAAHAVQHSRSGRFVKAYLLTWGLMATGALAYLGSLAWQPELPGTTSPQLAAAETQSQPDPALETTNRALAEIDTVQRSVGEIQRDVRQLKETVQQQEAQGKVVQTRLDALEQRTTPPEVPVAAAVPAPKPKVADTAKVHIRTAEPRPPTRVITTIDGPKPPGEIQPAPIETGSIAQAPIVFGDAVVTTAGGSGVSTVSAPAPAPAKTNSYAVQLGAGPSLDAIKLSWNLLMERHAGQLATLQPHVVKPRASGGLYRLVAGPLPTRAEADKICKDMGVGRNRCFATVLSGEPL